MSAPILNSLRLYAADETVTAQIAELLATQVEARVPQVDNSASPTAGIFYLQGDLGAGKTSFTRAFLRKLGVSGRIKSPSYGLVESYKLSSFTAYHLDFYRFNDPREWLDAGFRDILYEKQAVVLIEWPEKAANLLPSPDLTIQLDYHEPGRYLTLSAYSDKGNLWLEHVNAALHTINSHDSV